MNCTATINIHGYDHDDCPREAVDFCKLCRSPLCAEHCDCLGYCAECLTRERNRAYSDAKQARKKQAVT